ncbi:MAG TPA: tetratricopeptide repeat protein [Tepidisphaeraceae bacterium]|nr:tetratricopeptide repeat protein [Tepidisphaeraceae bacterium]
MDHETNRNARSIALPPITVLIGLAALTVLAYWPAFDATYIWDDPDYVINNDTLRDAWGLWRMWTDRTALPQYYPLVHTTFWIQYQLHELWWPGYHALNIALHAGSAFVFWLILSRLRLPGALLASAIFAVHPVMVESVAWVTERKNTLSLLLALLSLYCWMRPQLWPADPDGPVRMHSKWWRRWALLLFVGAMLSKSVVCALPAVMLVICWWQHGTIRRRDWIPLIPYFVIGLVLALNTADLERTKVGAVGPEWDYAPTALGEFAHRTLIAGRSVWFYLYKLVWPAELMFIYPRFQIDRTSVVAWMYPALLIISLFALLLLRHRIGRGPLAAAVIFVGVLFPALGYFNVYPHRYSFVADHFQYHASLAVIAGIAWLLMRLPARARPAAWVVVPILALLTYRYAPVYHNAWTLWSDVARKDPQSWIAWTNLGNERVKQNRLDDAAPYFRRALEVAPHVQDVQKNAGDLAMIEGRPGDAEQHYLRAIEIDARFVPAYVQMAALRRVQDDPTAAAAWLTRAFEIAPNNAEANFEAGRLLESQGLLLDALDRYHVAAERRTDDFDMQYNFGTTLLRLGRFEPAIPPLRRATEIRPTSIEAHANLAFAHAYAGQHEQASSLAARALALGATGETAERLRAISE